MDRGWTRETFAFALAVQNLAWGSPAPFAGMLADRFGAFRVLVAGSAALCAGLVRMALATTALAFTGSAGVLLGMAQAGHHLRGGLRRDRPQRRARASARWAMGVAAAAGSFGQFLMVPVEGWLIGGFGWQNALFVLGAAGAADRAAGLRPARAARVRRRRGAAQQSIGAGAARGLRLPSFLLLMAGYFVCGFQVVFIGVHMPSYLKDQGLSPDVASYALALIGLFNVFGTYAAGSLGAALAKRYILAAIYVAALGGDRRLPAGAADADERVRVRRGDGLAVAVDRAADQRAWSRRSSACATCRCSAASCS